MNCLILCALLLSTLSTLHAQENAQQYRDLSYLEIDSIVHSFYLNGKFGKAIPYVIAAREKAKIDFGEQDSIFAEYTNSVGFFYTKIALYEKALPFYIQAKNIREKVLGTEHPNFANSLNNLATLYIEIGNYDKALFFYIKSIRIKEKQLGAESSGLATSLNNLAALHSRMGNYERALPLYIQTRNIQEKALGTEHWRFALALNNLAVLHYKMRNYKKALIPFEQAKNIYEKTLGPTHARVAIVLNNLGSIYQVIGNNKKAISLYTKSIDIYKENYGKDYLGLTGPLSNLAKLYEEIGDYQQALALYNQAKRIKERILGQEHPEFAKIVNGLAKLHGTMSNYKRAWELLDSAIHSQSKISAQKHFSKHWFNQLKESSYPSVIHLGMVITSFNHMYLLLEQDTSIRDKNEKRLMLADLATTLLTKQRNSTSNEQAKLRMLSANNKWLLKSLSLSNPESDQNKAFKLADQNKSVLLLQATKSETAYRLGELPDSLARQNKKLLKQHNQLQAKLYEKRPKAEKDSLRSVLNQINQQLDDFEQLIRKNHPKYHKLKYQQVETKVQDIQALLDEQTALIEYVIGDSVVHIFCITKDQIQWKKTFVSNETLNDYIKKFHKGLSNYQLILKNKEIAYKSYTKSAHWFYKKLRFSDKSRENNNFTIWKH